MNIAKILKDAPVGTKLYSTIFGDIELLEVKCELEYSIRTKICKSCDAATFTKEGKYNIKYPGGECVIFPSKENRDWNTFKVEKSYEFKPFDKVLVRDCKTDKWICNYFSHMYSTQHVCSGGNMWNYCIPYNDDTKHLVGTNKDF